MKRIDTLAKECAKDSPGANERGECGTRTSYHPSARNETWSNTIWQEHE